MLGPSQRCLVALQEEQAALDLALRSFPPFVSFFSSFGIDEKEGTMQKLPRRGNLEDKSWGNAVLYYCYAIQSSLRSLQLSEKN